MVRDTEHASNLVLEETNRQLDGGLDRVRSILDGPETGIEQIAEELEAMAQLVCLDAAPTRSERDHALVDVVVRQMRSAAARLRALHTLQVAYENAVFLAVDVLAARAAETATAEKREVARAS